MKDTKICVVGLDYLGLPLARLFSTKYPTVFPQPSHIFHLTLLPYHYYNIGITPQLTKFSA